MFLSRAAATNHLAWRVAPHQIAAKRNIFHSVDEPSVTALTRRTLRAIQDSVTAPSQGADSAAAAIGGGAAAAIDEEGGATGMGQLAESFSGIDPAIVSKLLLSIGAVVAIWLVRRVVVRIFAEKFDEPRVRYLWGKGSAYVAYALAFLILGQIWLASIQNLGTFLGLLTAGLAIALKDLVSNLAGWAFILMRHPFRVGDRIQIGEHRGDVVDLRLFQFTLLEIGNWVAADQSTGRIIHVPNSQVFSVPVANYTDEFEFLWHETPVLVTFESNWRKAKSLLQEILDREARDVAAQAAQTLRRGSRKFAISFRHFGPKVYTSVEDSGVMLTMRFMAPTRSRRAFSERLWEAMLDAFDDADDIDLAYPTQRAYLNPVEGKTGARSEWPVSPDRTTPE